MNTKLRRAKLFASLPDSSIVYFFSGNAPAMSQDENYPFVVNRNFYYLTGLDAENMALMMIKRNDETKSIIFIEPFDPAMARWVGPKMLKEEVLAQSEVDEVLYIDELDNYFAGMYERSYRGNLPTFYFDMWRNCFDQRECDGIGYANKLIKRYPHIKVVDIYPYITKLRLHKDEEEISMIENAIAITADGIKEMMRHIRPNMNEMMMEATFDFILKSKGCKELAFNTIAASGERATTLHYSLNNNIMKDGELFLSDLGATYKHYCADISRTYPVNGHFNDRQKEIYNLVLEAQYKVEEAAKPGVKIRDLQNLVINFYREELPKHGLYKEVSEYYFHGIGHHLGLDTHDVDGGLGGVLEEGHVITNEPGLYIRDEGIGIRIEDDLLITQNGSKCLSNNIIKTIEDIEKFMH